MINVLNRYEENEELVTDYTTDGVTISHTLRQLISQPIEPQPTSTEPTQEEIQAQILLNTEYLVIMSEITSM